MNKVILFGNVGKDPVISKAGEKKVARFSLATTSPFKDKDGNKVTQWHNIVYWDKKAEVVEKFIKKGSSIIVEGEIRYGSYIKDGVTHYTTDINGNELHFTGSNKPANNTDESEKKSEPSVPKGDEGVSGSDDLPF